MATSGDHATCMDASGLILSNKSCLNGLCNAQNEKKEKKRDLLVHINVFRILY